MTPKISGGFPGSWMQYEIPLQVVPMSNATTSLGGPVYGLKLDIVKIFIAKNDNRRIVGPYIVSLDAINRPYHSGQEDNVDTSW